MLSVFGFGFFGVLPLQFFGFFCRSTLVRFRFYGKLLCNRIFQTSWFCFGNLGCGFLIVLQGEMLPFFVRFLLQVAFIIRSYIGHGLS